MLIDVNASDIQTSDAIYEHVHREVEKAMRNFADRVTRVEVHLKDVNANKGGIDKRVMMEARPAGLDPIAVEEHADDVYIAVRSAAEKLETALSRRFEKIADTHGRG